MVYESHVKSSLHFIPFFMILLTNPKQILLKAKSAFPCVHAPSKLPPPGYVVRLTAYHSTKVQSFNACSKIKTIMRNEVVRES